MFFFYFGSCWKNVVTIFFTGTVGALKATPRRALNVDSKFSACASFCVILDHHTDTADIVRVCTWVLCGSPERV